MIDFSSYERQVNQFFDSQSVTSFEHTSCFMCHSTLYIDLFTKGSMQIALCECGLVYNKKQPSERILNEFYEDSKALRSWSKIKEWKREESRQQGKFDPAIDFLLKNNVESLVDIGCGNGKFLDIIGDRMHAYGTEPNIDAYNACMKKKLPVFNSDIDTFNEENYRNYDAVTLWGVLEHLKNPRQKIERLTTRIKRGGYLLFCVPNVGSRVVRQLWRECFTFCPQHLWYFNWSTIKRYMKSLGFTPVFQYSIEHEARPVLRSTFGLRPYGNLPEWVEKQYLKSSYVNAFGKIILKEDNGYKLVLIGKKNA